MFSDLDSISSDLWLLPDGVDELLPPEAHSAEELRRRLLDLYNSWGYQLVFPPLIEYLESLLTGVGQDLNLQTFKITDQGTGKLMGIRADMTPQIARIDARNEARGAHRVCYMGTVLRTRNDNLFPSRAPVQTGCELFGVSDTAADIEVISMMLETLHTAGIARVHLDLAHVGIYQLILSKADLGESAACQLLSALQRKSVPEVQELAGTIEDTGVRKYVLTLLSLSGDLSVLENARALFSEEPRILDALEKLSQVAQVISSRYPEVEIYIDLCEMRGFNYHTGLVFAAYTQGMGQAIAQGGRYDGVGSEFGRSRPATGFSADLKALLRIGDFACQQSGKAILAPAIEDAGLWKLIGELRQTDRVISCMPDEKAEQWRDQCDRMIVKNEQGDWMVVALG